MKMPTLSPRFFRVSLCVLLLAPWLALEGRESWTDLDGNTFEGDPAGTVGPLALFKTGRNTGRHVLLSRLSPADCLRFVDGVKALPERMDSWSEAEAPITGDCVGRGERVGRMVDGEWVGDDLAGTPEPEFMILFFGSHGIGRTWGMLGDSREAYGELRKDFGDKVEGLFFGLNHSESEQIKIARDMSVPWLVCDYRSERYMDHIQKFAPANTTAIAVVNRHGVPLLVSEGETKEDVEQLMRRLRAFLEADEPNNPRTWPALIYFHGNVRKARFADGEAPPMAVGSPLRPEALKEYGVTGFTAHLQVDAQGQVSGVMVDSGPGIPDKLIPAVSDALKATPVVPAVRNGEFVEGTATVRFGDAAQ